MGNSLITTSFVLGRNKHSIRKCTTNLESVGTFVSKYNLFCFYKDKKLY